MIPNPAIVTTSWDDGHPLDVRTADLLTRFGMKGTFYIPAQHEGRAIDLKAAARPLLAAGMGIGAHTLTHPCLPELTGREMWRELHESKDRLEQASGTAVNSVCYPRGAHNTLVCKAARASGYRLGRTTMAFHTGTRFDPVRMPVTLQLCPQPRSKILSHAVKEGNGIGLRNWVRVGRCATGLRRLVALFYSQVCREGGILHLWGHSWEIEKLGLWSELEEILRLVSGNSQALYLDNEQALHAAGSGTGG
jgi:hypothetical protein